MLLSASFAPARLSNVLRIGEVFALLEVNQSIRAKIRWLAENDLEIAPSTSWEIKSMDLLAVPGLLVLRDVDKTRRSYEDFVERFKPLGARLTLQGDEKGLGDSP